MLVIFFATGFAALVYQTIWQRMLTLYSGADLYSVTIIVAAFMAGLGFGNLVGGHLADRLGTRERLWTFAASEFAVAAFALVSATIYYDVLYGRFGAIALSRSGMAAVIFAVTLVPTFLMGLSLPLIAKLPASEGSRPAVWISRLYGWNTLGAAAGSLAVVTLLFQSFDLRLNLRVGAVVSGCCALAAFLASGSREASSQTPQPGSDPTLTSDAVKAGFSFRSWMLLYTLSGFVALSLEIFWFRALGVMLKSGALTFGYLLALYLGGVGCGSLLAERWQGRRLNVRRAFLLLQAGVPLWAGVSWSVLVATLGRADVARPLWEYVGSPVPTASPGVLLVIYGCLPLLLIVPSTLMMGMSFGLLQRAVQTDLSRVGRHVGWLQSANILGATAGAIVTGVWLLDWLGSAGTLKALVGCASVYLALFVHSRKVTSWAARLSPAVVFVLVALMPNGDGFWAALHGERSDSVIVGEGGSGLILIRLDSDDTKVFLGGISQSWLPYSGIHTALGALPALLHPRPVDIAVIGLGSGDTLYSSGGRSETRVLDSIEIMAAQRPALLRLADRREYPALRMVLNDPRVRYEVADARVRLRKSRTLYDIIETDPLFPFVASSGNLYSIEYFGLLRDRLKPGGFAVTWVPTERTYASFLTVFPYVLKLRSIAIGSLSPIAFDPSLVRRRMRDPFTSRYYSAGGIDLATALEPFLSDPPIASNPLSDRSRLTDLNHDLFPKDEFGIPYDAASPVR